MMDRRCFLQMGAAGLAMSTTRATAQSAAANYPPDYAKIIEASRGEPDLIAYSNMSPGQWRPTLEAFKAAYPWISVQTLDINANEAMERYFAESATGSRTADLIVTVAPDAWIDMIDRKQILAYASPEASAYPVWSLPSPGLYTAALDPLVFLWNKALLPEKLWPTSFADLVEKVKANPGIFRRKLTSYSANLTSYGYNAHYFFAKHHGDKVWDWYRTLGPETRFERSAGPMVEKVTTGEYVLAYFCGSSAARTAVRDPARARIVGMSYISDGTPMVFRGLGIPIKSARPNSAKLLLDFMLSETGQRALAAGSRTPVRPSVTSESVGGAETFSQIEREIGSGNTILVNYDRGLVSDHESFVRKWREANRA